MERDPMKMNWYRAEFTHKSGKIISFVHTIEDKRELVSLFGDWLKTTEDVDTESFVNYVRVRNMLHDTNNYIISDEKFQELMAGEEPEENKEP